VVFPSRDLNALPDLGRFLLAAGRSDYLGTATAPG
jgi:hypothetical protein